MKIDKKLSHLFVLGSVVASLSSCSHGPEIQEFPETANAAEEMNKLDADIQTANKKQLGVLSPKAFKEAVHYLDRAREAQQKVKDPKDILHEIAQSRAYLNQAEQFGHVSKNNLEQVLAARQKAIKAGAPAYFGDDFRSVDEKLTDVTSDIEKNKLGSAEKNHHKLLGQYLDLELRAMKQTYLGQARHTIELALKEGAADYAVQSLAVAQKKVKDADAFIVANRHATDQINSKSADARASADHLLKITREAKDAKKVSPEELALRMEREHEKAAGKKGLEEDKQHLQSEIAFNEKFEDARSKFNDTEAEVYKQGNNLLIRLKELNFPVGQSVVLASNFPLLTKVQEVIKLFGNASIVVEGHTDSDGSAKINKKLSNDRAHSIMDYLISTGVVKDYNIKAVGYGFEKPLAPNKTPKGKAQNRRVDIIISPERVAEAG